MNAFTCLFVWLLRRAFPSAFFSLFCLPFFLSLSLSRVVCCFVTLRHHHKNTHPQKSHQTQFSLFLSLQTKKKKKTQKNVVVVFASSLICSSFLSFWSSEECKRKARRENINFINFWGGVSGKAVTKTISSSFTHHQRRSQRRRSLRNRSKSWPT